MGALCCLLYVSLCLICRKHYQKFFLKPVVNLKTWKKQIFFQTICNYRYFQGCLCINFIDACSTVWWDLNYLLVLPQSAFPHYFKLLFSQAQSLFIILASSVNTYSGHLVPLCLKENVFIWIKDHPFYDCFSNVLSEVMNKSQVAQPSEPWN